MAKMVDVANKAGVSIKTVSRVLNNEPHVKDDLRRRVKEAAATLGYVPSPTARSLRSRRSYCINLVSHTIASNYVNAILAGAVQSCQDNGYVLMVSLLSGLGGASKEELKKKISELIASSKPDGVILVPPHSNDKKVMQAFSELGVRVVGIGPNDPSIDMIEVMIDEREAAKEITNHLIDLGHRRIALVRGKEDQNATHERFAGYKSALEAAGITLDRSLIEPGEFNFASGLKAGDALLARDERPTAIFAANDDMAAGVLMAAHRLGIEVPKNLSIVGFDDSEISEKTWPALTTIHQPLLELGSVATDLLIKSIHTQPEERRPLRKYLEHEIIYRDSTAPVPDRV